MLMEPVTSLTDVVLTIIASGIAWRLWRSAPRPLTRRDSLWAGSFAALAVATTLGALIHGFPLGPAHFPVWAAIRLWTSISEVVFFLAALFSVVGESAGRRLTPGVLAAFGFLFVALVLTHDYFMLFEALGIGGATALYAFHYTVTGHPRALALPGASLFFAVGAGLQAEQASFDLVWRFNGDDIFHLALMGALACIAVAAHPSLPALDGDAVPRWPRPLRLPSPGFVGPAGSSLPWRALQALAERLRGDPVGRRSS